MTTIIEARVAGVGREDSSGPCLIYYDNMEVCGTDGKTYGNESALKCKQRTEYGKRVNLQVSHRFACWSLHYFAYTYRSLFVILLLSAVFGLITGVCLCIWRIKRAFWTKNKTISTIITA